MIAILSDLLVYCEFALVAGFIGLTLGYCVIFTSCWILAYRAREPLPPGSRRPSNA